MRDHRTGAVAVVRNERPMGIFTYRDLIERVVLPGLPLDTTPIEKVHTAQVHTIGRESSYSDALRLMTEHDFSYLPVIESDGRFLGLVSLPGLLQHRVDDLAQQLDSLTLYFAVDGMGGD
jgi:CBS domain-containing protein